MLTRYHSVFCLPRIWRGACARKGINRTDTLSGTCFRIPASLLTDDDSGFLTNLEELISILEIQIAAPGGFSTHLADPALTTPGLAASMDRFTRSHLSLCYVAVLYTFLPRWASTRQANSLIIA